MAPAAVRPPRRWSGLALRPRRSRSLVALNRADHALAARRDFPVLHVARPRIDDVGRGIDVLRIAGTQRDRVAAVKVLRAFVAVWPAAGGGRRHGGGHERANDLDHGDHLLL